MKYQFSVVTYLATILWVNVSGQKLKLAAMAPNKVVTAWKVDDAGILRLICFLAREGEVSTY